MRTIAMTGLLVLWAPCALADEKKNAEAAAAAAAEAQAAASRLNAAKDKSDADCAPLENRAVPPAEEKAMGLELAVIEAAGKGLYVDGASTEAAAVRKQLQDRLATLPPGDKSAVTAYVQRIGKAVAGPKTAVTFAVVDDTTARLSSHMGGYVFITRGLLAQLEDEAELAAALAHELTRLNAHGPTEMYAKARFTSCRISVTGANLMVAGAMGVPGGAELNQNSKTAKTMQALAAPDLVAAMSAPDVDGDYIKWTLARNIDMQRMMDRELVQKADEGALPLLAKVGYDTKGLAKVITVLDAQNAQGRIGALAKKQRKGKAPAFPAALKWPK